MSYRQKKVNVEEVLKCILKGNIQKDFVEILLDNLLKIYYLR